MDTCSEKNLCLFWEWAQEYFERSGHSVCTSRSHVAMVMLREFNITFKISVFKSNEIDQKVMFNKNSVDYVVEVQVSRKNG